MLCWIIMSGFFLCDATLSILGLFARLKVKYGKKLKKSLLSKVALPTLRKMACGILEKKKPKIEKFNKKITNGTFHCLWELLVHLRARNCIFIWCSIIFYAFQCVKNFILFIPNWKYPESLFIVFRSKTQLNIAVKSSAHKPESNQVIQPQ